MPFLESISHAGQGQRGDAWLWLSSQDEQAKKRSAGSSPKGAKKELKVAAWSCLDGLWEAVKSGSRLRAQQPAVLAHALRALLAMWQVRSSQNLLCPMRPLTYCTQNWCH